MSDVRSRDEARERLLREVREDVLLVPDDLTSRLLQEVPGLPTPAKTRAVERRVVALLRTYTDALHNWDVGSSGDGVRLMPSMWNEGSYSELERALRSMRDGSPELRRLWWHVSARYLWLTLRKGTVRVKRSRLGPVAIPPPHAEIEVVLEMFHSTATARMRCWSRAVDPELVRVGVSTLADLMYEGDHGRVIVPRGALDARAGVDTASQR